MSSRSKRSATPAKTPRAGSSSRQASEVRDEPPQPPRPGSPLSPTIISRRQEKNALSNLNDRLAQYIELVQKLQSDKSNLEYSLSSIEESHTVEIKRVKATSEKEIEDIRKALDRESSAKSSLAIEKRRLLDELLDVKNKLKDKTNECAAAETKLARLEALLNEVNHNLNQEKTKSSQLTEDKKKLVAENKRIPILEHQIGEQKKAIDQEQLKRIELENENQSLREQLNYDKQVYETRVEEVQKKRKSEISEVDSRLNRDYENRLQEQLRTNRALFEEEFKKTKQELVKIYEGQLGNQERIIENLRKEQTSILLELKESKGRSGKYDAEMNELRAANYRLTERNKELEDQLEYEQSKFARMEAEIKRLQTEMTEQLKDYRELMEIKINLDSEIAQYRNLMEAEESRLNITGVGSVVGSAGSTPSRGTAGPSKKRKLNILEEYESEERSSSGYQVTSSSKGNIEITEVDPDGKFVKLYNKGTEEQSLGNWHIIRKVKGEVKTSFKFHRTLKVEPGGTVTVWSFNVDGATHEPPNNIVMKNQKFGTGDEISTVLLNTDGQELAVADQKAESHTTRSHLTSSSEGYIRSYRSRTGREELFHQQGDSNLPGEDERCSIM
uniref:Lamin Dm0 n=1 Tax=Cacopsylla melanoneura TaxID=428564 RepID=A0A8D8XY87_9HEMI